MSLFCTSREGQDLMRHTFSYDNNGNQVAKMEQHQLTLYGYDRLNRLLEVDYGSGAQESFSYDRAGNRIRRVLDGQTTSYTYDNRNRLLTLLEEDSRQTEFEYDRQGNMVSERSGSGTTTYSYDAFNRTAKVEKPDGSHIRHFYDPEGLRSGLRENGVTSRFVYDRWNMVNELDGDHNVKASYVRGHEWLAQVDGRGDSYYYLNNQHGDVAHITNRLGGIVNSYEYDAFGRTLSATEGIPNRFCYAGEQYDQTTEQYYLRARFYNPVIARFTQEDEYRGDGLNLYAYVGNNPINYVDPSGYSSQSVGCGGGGKKEGPFGKTGKPDFSKHHDYVAHDGYYNRKEFRSNIAKAESSEHGFKHIKAKTEDEALRFSETGDKHAQYLPTIKNKVLEREALQKGLIFQDRKKGAIYFFYNVGKKVGYDLGDETTWIRAELTSGGVYHGHPISSKRLSKYIDKALTRDEFFEKILRE